MNGELYGDDEIGQGTVEADTQRQKRVEDGIHLVLQEQSIQSKHSGRRNPESIARAYSGATKESKLLARRRASDVALQVLGADDAMVSWFWCCNNMDSCERDTRVSDLGSMYIASPNAFQTNTSATENDCGTYRVKSTTDDGNHSLLTQIDVKQDPSLTTHPSNWYCLPRSLEQTRC